MSRSITSSDANGATFETVGSSGGFSAGDLVYYGSTGYNKIPASAVPSTATTSPTKAYPYFTPAGDSGYFQPTNFNGLGFSRSVALLSNGNAVAVYGNPQDGYPYFVVFNPSTRAIVVGPTVISTTFTISGAGDTTALNIGVSAFAGGNFLVFWGNNAGGTISRVNYATYTNAGVAVVAVTQDATLAVANTQSGHMRGVTLANGGFVLAFGSGNNVYFRAYDAAGVGQFAWVTLTGFSSSASGATNPTWGMAARSDNTYLLVGQSTVASTYNYAIYNYAGTAVVATTTFLNLLGSSSNGNIDCDVLSDGTTFVIAYSGQAPGGIGWAFRFLPTGNTLGSAFSVLGNFNTNTGLATTARLRVWSLGSTGFLITGADSASRGCYAVFNNSGAPLLGTTGTTGTASNIRNFGSTYTAGSQVLGVIVYGGVAEVYGAPNRAVNTPSTSFFRISLTDFNMVSATTTSAALTIPANLIGATASAPSASTPSKVAFAAGNGIYPYVADLSSGPAITTAGVYATPGGGISNVSAFDMCVLSNGNICVVTSTVSSGSTTVYIYNPITLAQISTADISATAGNSNTNAVGYGPISNVRVTPLSNGAFCVAIGTGATNLRLTAWTSAIVQQGSTVNITTMIQSFDAGGRFAALTTISGDRVVVAYFTSDTTLNYAVYSSALAVVQAATNSGITDSSAVRSVALVPVAKGFVIAAGRSTSGNIAVRTFYEFTTNTFTSPTYAQFDIASANTIYTFGAAANSGASYIVTIASTTTTAQLVGQATPAATVALNFGSPSSNLVCVGVTAAGAPFVMFQDGNVAGAAATSADMTAVTAITGWTSGPTTRTSSPLLRTIPLYGNLVLVGWVRDASNQLILGTMLVNGNPDSIPLTSADATTAAPIYPQPTTTTTPAVAGYTLAGVAVTDCAAGGTGVIQTTGATNLNSNYPTTTAQTFDYTGYAAPGIKGTISGRAISMRKS